MVAQKFADIVDGRSEVRSGVLSLVRDDSSRRALLALRTCSNVISASKRVLNPVLA